MINYFLAWVNLLHACEAIVGVPMCVGGGVLVIMGWRLWRAASIASLALAGAVVGQALSGNDGFDVAFAGGGAAVGIVIAVAFQAYSSTILGGVAGGCIIMMVLEMCTLTGPILWIVSAVGFVAALAWSFANRHRVVIAVTAIEGAALFVSGLAVMLEDFPTAYNYMHTTMMDNAVMLPFFVLVPAVIGICLQLADSNRSYSKAVRA